MIGEIFQKEEKEIRGNRIGKPGKNKVISAKFKREKQPFGSDRSQTKKKNSLGETREKIRQKV